MMRRFYLYIALFGLAATGYLEAESSAAVKSTKQVQMQFQSHIDKLIAQNAPNSNVGIEIVSLRSGLKLYHKNANHLFVPASSLKMFTAAAALSILGPDYTLSTTLWTDGRIEGDTLIGNLYLKGGADPELVSKDFEEMIEALTRQGLHYINGSLYVDNLDFDGVSQGPGWMWDDEPEYWNSPMDALTVNHSCLKLWVCPGPDCSAGSKAYVLPKTAFAEIKNSSLTQEDEDNHLTVHRTRSSLGNIIHIQGSIAKNSEPKAFVVSLSDPHLYAGHVFLELLSQNNVVISKKNIEVRRAPQGSRMLVEHRSRPLTLILQKMMKESDNLYADCLFKKIGQDRFLARGSWKSGSRAVRGFLSEHIDIDTSEMVVLDGSGLSRYNLVSPHHFISFLTQMKTSPYYGDFLASLSLSGVDGTLKISLNEPELKGRVRAKSGGMKGVKTLCGYVSTKDGEPLAFAIMLNGFVEPRPHDRRLENEICKFLAGYERN